MTRRLQLAVVTLLGWSIHAQRRRHHAVLTAAYTDPATHVSFTYPPTWRRVDRMNTYIPVPGLASSSERPLTGLSTRAIFTFGRERNHYYARTNLAALAFVYQTLPDFEEETCGDRITAYLGEVPYSTPKIHGMAFQEIDNGGVAAGHQGESHLYWIAKAGTCHLFETDLLTEYPDSVEPVRELKVAERQALRRQLAEIVRSIRTP